MLPVCGAILPGEIAANHVVRLLREWRLDIGGVGVPRLALLESQAAGYRCALAEIRIQGAVKRRVRCAVLAAKTAAAGTRGAARAGIEGVPYEHLAVRFSH